jgi:singapore isolate B (sub-type 7) whole genome shotgun sequence assembly, scaffold_1
MARKDRILIEHLGKEYVVDIIDCQPNIVVDIVECDVEVDIEYKDLYRLKGDMMVERKRSRSFRKHQKPNQCQ